MSTTAATRRNCSASDTARSNSGAARASRKNVQRSREDRDADFRSGPDGGTVFRRGGNNSGKSLRLADEHGTESVAGVGVDVADGDDAVGFLFWTFRVLS
jgi:hypothetical protein